MPSIMGLSYVTYLTVLAIAAGSLAQSTPAFPVVDLGYARHAPTTVKQTEGQNILYATYSNIRFAQPPTGDLRYRAPQIPPPQSEGVQNGSVPLNSTNCLQSIPPYLEIAPGVVGVTWGSEDCLFLDVKVPEGADGKKLPVLHWFYGGGFFFGAKEWAGDPAGLFQDMLPDGEFIVVSSNYRLGAHGFLYAEGEDATPNAAILDGLAALNWTKNHIHLFGGDPEQITVIGESAGAAIGYHLLAAHGGEGEVLPFKKAILTSVGYRSHVNRSEELRDMFDLYLKAANCTDLACLRAAPVQTLIQADEAMTFDKNISEGWIGPRIGFGPHPDGDLVPNEPDLLIREGKYHKEVQKVLMAHMAHDGNGVVNIKELDTWRDFLGVYMRTPTDEVVERARNMYPPIGQGGFDALGQDILFACHAQIAAQAWGRNGYRYSMSIPPAMHGQDQFYYLHIDPTVTPSQEVGIAKKLQKYFRNFISDGSPGGGCLDDAHDGSNVTIPRAWLPYGKNMTWMNITADGFVPVYGEPHQARRCDFVLEMMNDTRNGW